MFVFNRSKFDIFFSLESRTCVYVYASSSSAQEFICVRLFVFENRTVFITFMQFSEQTDASHQTS